MATTSYGSPYVSGSDLVAGWPAASLTVANAIDAAGYYIGRGINAQTASYTGVLTDAGKTVTMTVATSNTFTVPLNATVAYPTGTRINILNLGAGACTVTATGGVTISGTISALATNQGAAVVKTATNTWSYLPFTSGAGNAVISSTTGLAAGYPQTYSSGGKNYRVYLWNGSGTAVVGTAGLADVLIIGGGGGGGGDGGGGGGAGDYFVSDASTLPVALGTGTSTITIGAGGAGGVGANNGTNGVTSSLVIGLISATTTGGGGGAPAGAFNGLAGGSGGGGGGSNATGTGGADTGTWSGNAGGNGFARGGSAQSGGGGGASAAGANAITSSGGAGGAGLSSLFLDGVTNTTRAGGGGGGGYTPAGSAGGAGGSGGGGAGVGAGNGTAGTVNTGGGGGGGAGGGTPSGGAGGSGICIIRVVE